jgi:septal ring factor EnvC (AmiA/AmiB activator)
MKTIILRLTVATCILAGLFRLAGRSPLELKGLVRASADTAVDEITASLPMEVHDKKLDHELRQVRLDLIDRQVQMNLSKRQIAELTVEVEKLVGSTERRRRFLGEAYPVLKTAIDGGLKTVKFANEDHALSDFQKEIDDLLVMQDRETRQLEIKKTGLARLKKSSEEGEAALADIRNGLETAEQEVAVLRSRREQAEVETQALDLVNAATANHDTVASHLNHGVDRLRTHVDKTEARNEARRGTAPVTTRHANNGVSRSFNRLESLKAIHDATPGAPSVVTTKPAEPSTEVKSIEASKVVIEIQGKDK